MSSKKLTKSPTFQQVFEGIQKADTYGGIFPEMFKLINIMLTLPVGTATVERSFSQMKMIKTRLRNRLNGTNLKRLMGLQLKVQKRSWLTSMKFSTYLEKIIGVSSGGSRGVPRVPWNPPFQTTQLNIQLTYKYLFNSIKETQYY